jgi:hypothetical protein
MNTILVEKPPELKGLDLELAGSYFFTDGGGVVYTFKTTVTNEWYELVWKTKTWTKCKLVNEVVPQTVQLVE